MKTAVTADVTDGSDTALLGPRQSRSAFAYAADEVLHDLSLTSFQKEDRGASPAAPAVVSPPSCGSCSASGTLPAAPSASVRKVSAASSTRPAGAGSLVTRGDRTLRRYHWRTTSKIAKHDATRAEVEAACEAALDGFIQKLPKGYDTPGGRAGRPFPAASASASAWRGFPHDAPASCCWTSLPPTSTA